MEIRLGSGTTARSAFDIEPGTGESESEKIVFGSHSPAAKKAAWMRSRSAANGPFLSALNVLNSATSIGTSSIYVGPRVPGIMCPKRPALQPKSAVPGDAYKS